MQMLLCLSVYTVHAYVCNVCCTQNLFSATLLTSTAAMMMMMIIIIIIIVTVKLFI